MAMDCLSLALSDEADFYNEHVIKMTFSIFGLKIRAIKISKIGFFNPLTQIRTTRIWKEKKKNPIEGFVLMTFELSSN